jgi:glycosyltransferase involved in cell wall biosynthesis
VTTPSVSVVVPTRDRPELLARALASILGQRYAGEIECIVVFDQTEVMLPELAQKPGCSLRGVVNERTAGLAGARNTGFLAATGELVASCDDDDEWLPEKLAAQVEALAKLPKEALICCGIEVCHPHGSRVRLPRAETLSLRDLLRSRHMEFHTSTFLVNRRHLLGGIGLVDEEIPGSYGEDYDWLIRAARAGVVASVRRPLVRVHWSGSWFADRWDTIIASIEYMLAKHPEFEDEPRGLARLYGRIAFGHAALGHGRQSRAWALRSLGRNPVQMKAYLALLAGTGLLGTERILAAANRIGRGF